MSLTITKRGAMAVWTCGYFGPRGHCVVRGVRANQPRPWDAERLRRYAVDANASSPPETPKNLCVTMWRLTLALHSTCFVFKASCSNGDFLIYWFTPLKNNVSKKKKKNWGFGYVKSTGYVGDTASGRGRVNHEKVKQILHERFCLSELTWPFTQ